jgi:hypothetical protein
MSEFMRLQLPAREVIDGVPWAYVRCSLTPRCNLKCRHCHNEGQEKPWRAPALRMTLGNLRELFSEVALRGAKSFRLTGGEPTDHPDIEIIWSLFRELKESGTSIEVIAMTSNCIQLLRNKGLYEAFIEIRPLHKLAASIDGMGENARPASVVPAPSGQALFGFLERLRKDWPGLEINVNATYSGADDDTMAVVRAAHDRDFTFTILEEIGVRGSYARLGQQLRDLLRRIERELPYIVRPRIDLNEFDLIDKDGKRRGRAYPDHCYGETMPDCNRCRKLDCRFVADQFGISGLGCYQRSTKTELVVANGRVIHSAMNHFVRNTGTGPGWLDRP